jgi:vacuolar protein sorting-associated protein 41
LPSFNVLRVYRAHTASVTAISISPFPPPLPTKPEAKLASEQQEPREAIPSTRGKQPAIPNIPSNAIHIATSSIDGNVCVYSLLNPEEVILRKFGRPVHAVAISPNYKHDRTYVSGGKAGNLVVTVGGQAGKSSQSNTDPNASLTTGWLGAIGLGGNNGTDEVIHSGEGSITTIKWSLSGRFVVWVNEYGIKTMRTNLHLESNEHEFAWKRISHTDRPAGAKWEEMAGVWNARADWIDEDGLELEDDEDPTPTVGVRKLVESDTASIRSATSTKPKTLELKKEKLVVGWGDAVWIFTLLDGLRGSGKERRMGKAEIVTL